jgi:hypothetical protein
LFNEQHGKNIGSIKKIVTGEKEEKLTVIPVDLLLLLLQGDEVCGYEPERR